MADAAEIEAQFWKDLKSAPFVMLGLVDARDGHTQPMTAQFENNGGPLYFFTTKDNGLIAALKESSQRAIATYTGKGHDLFASIHGTLSLDNDNATIDRLWNPHVEAWFEGGRNDPRVALLRLDTEKAEMWLGGSTIGAVLTRLFGKDPKSSYKDNMADVAL
ncbi:MAG: ral stress protein [Rhizorhabdus sp.]|nr:ral stress protein [Rhizorhabdus sp.]